MWVGWPATAQRASEESSSSCLKRLTRTSLVCAGLNSVSRLPPPTLYGMATTPLGEFIIAHRDALLLHCEAKVAQRYTPLSGEANGRGLPLFLDDIVVELSGGNRSNTMEMGATATQHGADLFLNGCTVGQVVHDYGSVCQAVTDLAVKSAIIISPEDFRVLNRCLDDGIAFAVAEYSRQQRLIVAEESRMYSMRLRSLIEAAITGFEVLQTGKIGVGGTTGALVYRSLTELRAILALPPAAAIAVS